MAAGRIAHLTAFGGNNIKGADAVASFRKTLYGTALVIVHSDSHMGSIADLCFTAVSG